MSHLHLSRVILIGVLFVRAGSAESRGAVWSGDWSVQSYSFCPEVRDADWVTLDCSTAGVNKTVESTLRADVGPSGVFSFTDHSVYVEEGVGGEPPPGCNAADIYGGGAAQAGSKFTLSAGESPYVWRCDLTTTGSGFLRSGNAGSADFWIRHESTTFSSSGTQEIAFDPRNSFGSASESVYPFDLGIPAVAGTYGTSTVLLWEGLQDRLAPPGLVQEVRVRRVSA